MPELKLTESNCSIERNVMDTIEPIGYITRSHKDGILEKDGGKIISGCFLINEDVKGRNLYNEDQMREAIEKTMILMQNLQGE